MNKKEFINYEELRKFVEPMIAEQKWAIDVRQNIDSGIYLAIWIEHKSIDRSGVKVRDEIWTNLKGEMTCVQDLDPEHAKNILRMLLRSEREQRAMITAMATEWAAEAENTVPVMEPRTLH
jgi:hypothetical protein